MTQTKESPVALERFGASKKFSLTRTEHLIDSPSSKAKQGVSDNMIKGAHA